FSFGVPRRQYPVRSGQNRVSAATDGLLSPAYWVLISEYSAPRIATMTFRSLLLLAAWCLLPSPVQGQGKIALVTKDFLLSPEVLADAKDGSLCLAHSVLLADELGATDFHQSEELTERIQAKKVFALDSVDVTDAELFQFGGAKEILVNGKPVPKVEKLTSTGWTRAKVPVSALKAGENEVILKGGQLLIEPGGQPGRSFKSSDAGKTWGKALGKEKQPGEYLIRLRLGRYASRGVAQSQVHDLWSAGPNNIATPAKLLGVEGLVGLSKGQPQGTKLSA